VSEDALRDLAALAALEALEGKDADAFAALAASSPECLRELAGFRRVAERLPLGLTPVPPAPQVRARVLAAALAPPRAASRPWLGLAAAASVALACGAGWWSARVERDAARAQVQASAAAANEAGQRLQEAELRLAAALRRGLQQERGLQRLVAHRDTRLTTLAGLPAASGAQGRVLWSASSREAVLLATGLPPAPAGKTYEVWVIGRGAPVPAGVFDVGPEGGAVVALPALAATGEAKTFAVTLEPAPGTPAPTGPMVLAGAAG
jgi:hypothetical protein